MIFHNKKNLRQILGSPTLWEYRDKISLRNIETFSHCYKLKPFGFSVSGAIDGYSRKVLWLKVLRSSNSPSVIGGTYLGCVKEMEGCPIKLVTDLGTENVLAAAMQTFFRQDIDAHPYVPSPRNQRIESWWLFFCKTRGNWWKHFFLHLETEGVIDMTSAIDK